MSNNFFYLSKVAFSHSLKNKKQVIIIGVMFFALSFFLSFFINWEIKIKNNILEVLNKNLSGNICVISKDNENFDIVTNTSNLYPIIQDENIKSFLENENIEYITRNMESINLSKNDNVDLFSKEALFIADNFFSSKILSGVKIIEGRSYNKDSDEIIVMKSLADSIGLYLGDEIFISGMTVVGERTIKVKVTGFFEYGGFSIFINNHIMGSNLLYQQLFMESNSHAILINEMSESNIIKLKQFNNIQVLTGLQSSKLFLSIESIIRLLGVIITSFIFLVFFLIVFNLIYYLISIRKKEIKTMNVIGISKSVIYTIHSIETFIYTFFSTVSGLAFSFFVILIISKKGLPSYNDYISFIYGGNKLFIEWNNIPSIIILILNLGASQISSFTSLKLFFKKI